MFVPLVQVRTARAAWQEEYNTVRPHRALSQVPTARSKAQRLTD